MHRPRAKRRLPHLFQRQPKTTDADRPAAPPDDAHGIDPVAAQGAAYASAFVTLQPGVGSIGLRTYPLGYSSLHEQSSRIAEEFLVNSRIRRRDVEFESSVASYFAPSGAALVGLVGRYGKRGSNIVELPESVPLRMGLGETIARRRSVRAYTADAVPLEYVATIVRAACGITGYIATDERASRTHLRSTPSGGALYPIDLHVVALRVLGLDRAVFLYDARRDALWQTADGARVDDVLEAFATPEAVISARAAVAVILLVARPWRSMRKYGARGMRHVLHESGAIAEHIHLASVALGLGSVDCSSLYDDEVHEALGVDGLYETLVHAVVVGAVA